MNIVIFYKYYIYCSLFSFQPRAQNKTVSILRRWQSQQTEENYVFKLDLNLIQHAHAYAETSQFEEVQLQCNR